MVYRSIEESKEKKVFVNEFRPEEPFLELRGKKYYIERAWVELGHYEENFKYVYRGDHTIVINFRYEKGDSIDLHSFIREEGNGISRAWVNLEEDEYAKDTLRIKYRETLDSPKKNLIFLFFKKR
jgi:hypothetical protein